jgi:hypothetical protein
MVRCSCECRAQKPVQLGLGHPQIKVVLDRLHEDVGLVLFARERFHHGNRRQFSVSAPIIFSRRSLQFADRPSGFLPCKQFVVDDVHGAVTQRKTGERHSRILASQPITKKPSPRPR